MKDQRDGLVDRFVKCLLSVLSFFYGLGVRCVDQTYGSGLRKQHKVGAPVISVGNITLGGTGKTPFTIFLADLFVGRQKNPAILTRGYGRDESRMLEDELPDVKVLVGQDRVRNARWAVGQGKDVLILDDGFQHRRIARDLNILMVDGVSMFGNGCLFPRGILREPLSSLRRSDIIVLTKTDRIGDERKREVITELRSLAPGKPVILTRHRPYFLTDVTGAAYMAESIRGEKVILVSGIVDPDYFEFLTRGLGAEVVARLDNPDHHRYSRRDIEEMRSRCYKERADKIITTRKDFVKIKDLDISSIEDKLFVLDIVVEIVEGKENLLAGLDSIDIRQSV
jgi:tetraacyldisaccharide 4'-kinase